MIAYNAEYIKFSNQKTKDAEVDGYKTMLKQHLENTLTKRFPFILTFFSMHPDFNSKKMNSVFNDSYVFFVFFFSIRAFFHGH